MPPKPWWQSKTLWFNILSLIVLVLGTIQINGATVLPAAWLPYLALAVVIGNAVLRYITAAPIAGSPAAKASPYVLPGTPGAPGGPPLEGGDA